MNPNEDRNHVAYVRGDKAFRASRYAEAIAWFKEAVDEWPEDYQAHFALGNSYSAAGKHRKAELALREALRLSPDQDRPGIAFNLGNALFDQGHVAQALAVFESIPSGSSLHSAAVRKANLAKEALGERSGDVPKATVEAAPRLKHAPSRGGGLTRR